MILYFSATGNSKYVAERIREATGDYLYSIRLLSHDKEYLLKIKKGENLGIVIPVYFGSMPSFVSDYIKEMKIAFGGDNFIYAVATYGGGYGNIGSEMIKQLTKCHVHVDSTFAVKATENWIYSFNLNDEEYVKQSEINLENELNEVINNIVNKKRGVFLKDNYNALKMKMSKSLYNSFRKTDGFKVDESKCVGCKACELQCPSKAIEVKDNHPIWIKKKCTLCFGCINRCPKNAIIFKDKTRDNGQYINKKVKLDFNN